MRVLDVRTIVLSLLLSLLVPCCTAQEAFPSIKAFQYAWGIEGPWNAAEQVIIGDVSNVRSIGSQEMAALPRPMPASIHTIYWCAADFRADAAVKGSLPPVGTSLLWGQIRPSCTIETARYGYGEAAVPSTRVWFLRQEGKYLRPVVDIGGVYFVAFHVKWNPMSQVETRRTFAELLLNPEAIGLNADNEYTALDSVEVARSILGIEGLTDQLRRLTANPRVGVRLAACKYLEEELKLSCEHTRLLNYNNKQ